MPDSPVSFCSGARRILAPAALLAFVAGFAVGQPPPGGPASLKAAEPEPPVISVTLQGHGERLALLRENLQVCAQNPARCDAASVGPDERLTLPNGTPTLVHYRWLRQTLTRLHAPGKQGERATLAAAATARLGDAGDPPIAASPIPADRASRTAAEVLAQVEFTHSRPSWLSLAWERLMYWLARHLRLPGSSHGTQRWLRLLVEAGLFGTPVLLLFLWLLRQVREDRLRPAGRGSEAAPAKDVVFSWLEEAERWAREGEWREAIHALYWQTVASLEERKLISRSRTRTPRETLRLLLANADSCAQDAAAALPALGEQTMLLERVWYGGSAATEQEYLRARDLQQRAGMAGGRA